MARYDGTNREFKRHIGPHLRNLVNQLTKRQKKSIGACQHCGDSENLEAAHIQGRDRVQIIDMILGTSDPHGLVSVDLKQFELKFKSEHEPLEKAILILCKKCLIKYDNGYADQYYSDSMVTHDSATIPITIDPPCVMIFHEAKYLSFIRQRGVGANDRVASSPDSYKHYLRAVAKRIGKNITPETVGSEEQVREIVEKLQKLDVAQNTIRNYRSALRQYVLFANRPLIEP